MTIFTFFLAETLVLTLDRVGLHVRCYLRNFMMSAAGPWLNTLASLFILCITDAHILSIRRKKLEVGKLVMVSCGPSFHSGVSKASPPSARCSRAGI